MITCTAKVPQSRAELWHIHLIPARGSTTFSLKSMGRKRYARSVVLSSSTSSSSSSSSTCGQLVGSFGNNSGSDSVSTNGSDSPDSNCCTEQVQVDATCSWGSETLFQFKYYEGGKYALLTSSCKFITCEGTCIDWIPPSCKANGHSNGVSITIKSAAVIPQLPPPESLFTIEYHGGNIAFRDCNGRYLAAAGRSAILRTRSSNVSRDEMFELEPAPIQVAFRADFNNRYVSVKQGIDLAANQSDVSAKYETFELEFNLKSETWNIRSKDGNYWAPGAASTIQASSREKRDAGYFRLKWTEDGTCSILATDSNGTEGQEPNQKWVCARKSGQLCFSATDPVGFHMMFQNRRSLNLRPVNGTGFVGLKHPDAGKLEANKTSADAILVEYANSDNSDDVISTFNCCYLKMSANNKYWSVVDGESVAADASSTACAQQFQIELRSGSSIAIRIFDTSSYLNLSKQGTLIIVNCGPKDATQWEF